LGGKAGVMTAFEKWFNAGGARAYAMSNGLEDEQRTIKDFKDEVCVCIVVIFSFSCTS
jgi:hypothetical protein